LIIFCKKSPIFTKKDYNKNGYVLANDDYILPTKKMSKLETLQLMLNWGDEINEGL